MINNEFVEIKLRADFLVIKESLTRIGICNRNTKVIIPSCYIIHKSGRYAIAHFKELLASDGYRKEISEIDINRRNAIATLLENWGLIEILDDECYQAVLLEKIFVLSHKEKKEQGYKIVHKYNMDTK